MPRWSCRLRPTCVEVVHHRHPVPDQQRRVADARELQEHRRHHRPGREDDLAARRARDLDPAAPVVDADRPPPLEPDPRHLRPRHDLQVRPAHRRPQVGGGRRGPHPAPGGDLIDPDPLLPRAVEVRVAREPRRLAGGEPGLAERMHLPAHVRDVERPAGPAPLVGPGRVVLHPPEHRADVLPAPARGCRAPPSRRNRRAGRGCRPWR